MLEGRESVRPLNRPSPAIRTARSDSHEIADQIRRRVRCSRFRPAARGTLAACCRGWLPRRIASPRAIQECSEWKKLALFLPRSFSERHEDLGLWLLQPPPPHRSGPEHLLESTRAAVREQLSVRSRSTSKCD